MRVALLVAVLGIPLTATAEPLWTDVVVHGAKHMEPGTAASFTGVSRTIYLNPCLPNGCTVYPGYDDARTDHSSIPSSQALLTAWPHGTTAWNNLVQCVQKMYAPFNITVTDVDPGSAAHFEVMMAGKAAAVGVPGAGGVAPFVPCDGQLENNVLTFVFAADISNQDFLCWAAAQESAHVFGLDHELDAKDPMTYLSPPVAKEGFQNNDANCGEDTPRECYCGGQTQNSWQHLMDTFGPKTLEPASISIIEPKDGQWVKPGFKVTYQLMSQLSLTAGTLKIDDTTAASFGANDPSTFTTPATLAGGDHVITVSGMDNADRMLSAQITVHVTASCANGVACAGDTHCLGGYCLPGADVAGGLGSPCTTNEECITGTCGSDGTNSLCTGGCDQLTSGGYVCPDGYECLGSTGAGGVCWPAADDSGCCSTASKPSPMLLVAGLGFVAVVLRRRRRR